MLRLSPTEIRLDAKDITWHLGRHHDRQVKRAELSPAEARNIAKNPPKQKEDSPAKTLPKNSPYRLALHPAEAVCDNHSPIFSKEPVPGNARSFWDRILADAGTPTRTQFTGLASTTIINPSDDFLKHNHSSRASIEDSATDIERDTGENGEVRAHRVGHIFHDSAQESSSGSPTPTSSQNSDLPNNDQLDNDRLGEEKSPEDNTQAPSSKRRLSFFSFHRKGRPANVDGSSENVEHSISDTMALDGPSDPGHSHCRVSSKSLGGSRGTCLQDGPCGRRDHERTISSSIDAFADCEEEDTDNQAMTLPQPIRSTIRQISPDLETFASTLAGGDRLNQSARDPLIVRSTIGAVSRNLEEFINGPERAPTNGITWPVPTNQTAIGSSRQPSVTLPPSSLRFSQTMASSSPDRHLNSAADQDNTVESETPGLLTHPPRRPRRYRPRTESYSFEASDEFSTTFYPAQVDGTSTIETPAAEVPRLFISSPPTHRPPPVPNSSAYGEPAPNVSPPPAPNSGQPSPFGMPHYEFNNLSVSPRDDPNNYSTLTPQHQIRIHSYRSFSSSSSSHSHPSSSHSHTSSNDHTRLQRRLSPYPAENIPHSALRRPSSQLSLPPPFSATPRHVSVEYALPTLTPHPPRTPPRTHITTHPSHSPNSPVRIPVYNDNRDPATQPQTPAGLRRNGLPIMTTQNPFNTAPARARTPALNAREQRVQDWQAFATPTRRPSRIGRNHRDEQQENAYAIGEEERILRREMGLGLRIGREEAGRAPG